MKNKSGLTPLGQAVLLKPYEAKEVMSSIIEIPVSAEERHTMAEQRAIVVAVGPEAWGNEKAPRAKPGDHVMVSAYAGQLTKGPKDGERYRVVNGRDIFLRII